MRKYIIPFLFLVLVSSAFAQGLEALPAVTTHKDLTFDKFHGKIQFADDIETRKSNSDLFKHVTITSRTIYVDSLLAPELNKPANITFYDTGIENDPVIFRNGRMRRDIKLVKVGTDDWQASVPGFSAWTIAEDNWPGTVNETRVANGNLTIDGNAQLILHFDQDDSLVSDGAFGYAYSAQGSAYINTTHSARGFGSYSIASTLDSISVPDTDEFSFTDGSGNDLPFSIAMWFNTGNGTDNGIVGKYTNPNLEYYARFTSGKIEFGVRENGTSERLYSQTTGTYNDSTWHHLVLTYNGSEIESGINIYVDGILVSQNRFDAAGSYTGMVNTPSPLEIGQYYSTGFSFDGLIDEVYLFDRVITSEEIYQLKGRFTNTLRDNLVIELALDDDTEDYSGNNYDATNSGGTLVEARLGKGYDFDGAADDMEVNGSTGANHPLALNNTDYTIAVWVKTNNNNDAFGEIADKGSSDNYWRFDLTTGQPRTLLRDGTTTVTAASSTKLTNNTWYHLVARRGEGNLSIFINGALDETVTDGATGNIGNAAAMKIGSTDGDSLHLDGSVSKLAIWNTSLTNAQIEQIYNESVANYIYDTAGNYTSLVYNVSDYVTGDNNFWKSIEFVGSTENMTVYGQIGNATNVTEGNWRAATRFDDLFVWPGGLGATHMRFRIDGVANELTGTQMNLDNFTINANNNTAPVVTTPIVSGFEVTDNLTTSVSATDTDGDAVRFWYQWDKNGHFTEFVSLPFNGGSDEGSTPDYGGKPHLALVNSGAAYNETLGPDGSGAYDFDGSTGSISVNYSSDLDHAGAVTFMAWVWIDTRTGTDFMFQKATNGWSGFIGGSNNVFWGGASNYIKTTASYSTGEWHHYAFTYDGGSGFDKLAIYIDGVNQSISTTGNFTGFTQSGQDLAIGKGVNAGSHFNGKIDDFRAFNYSLSPEQIASYYNDNLSILVAEETTLLDNWRVCVTGNDGLEDSIKQCSGNVTIVNNDLTVAIDFPANGTLQQADSVNLDYRAVWSLTVPNNCTLYAADVARVTDLTVSNNVSEKVSYSATAAGLTEHYFTCRNSTYASNSSTIWIDVGQPVSPTAKQGQTGLTSFSEHFPTIGLALALMGVVAFLYIGLGAGGFSLNTDEVFDIIIMGIMVIIMGSIIIGVGATALGLI